MTFEMHQGGAENDAQAAAWVVRLAADDAGFDDFEAFEAWLSGGSERGVAYDRALALWTAPLPEPVSAVRATMVRRRVWSSPAVWGGLAAAAAVAAVVFVGMPVRVERYVTAPGEHRDIALADGSRVALNAASTLEVRWSRKLRSVSLPQGEALFDVAHDPSRPMIVQSGERSVRVVGTAFDVKARGDDLQVTVSRGVVEVRAARGASPLRLVRGDQARFAGLHAPGRIAKVAPEEADSWRTGRLIYHDAGVGEVVQALNIQFGPPTIHVTRPASDLRFSGVLMLDERDKVIRRLTAALPLQTRRDAAGVTLDLARSPAR
ncbi:FecR family protein [soil metagenome]